MKPIAKWCIADYNRVEINLRLFFNEDDKNFEDIWLGTQSEEDAREFWLKYNDFQYGPCLFIPIVAGQQRIDPSRK